MKLIITETQAKFLFEGIKDWGAGQAAKIAVNNPELAKKVGASTSDATKGKLGLPTGALSPEMSARFDDINIEKDAPNLYKFLSGLQNTTNFSALAATNKGGKEPVINIPKGKEMMHPLGHSAKISSNFGNRNVAVGTKNHKGVDISTNSGTPIYAPLDAMVLKSKDTTPDPCGGHIRLKHNDGIETKFCHLSKMVVKPGEKIKKGAVIGYSGGGKNDPHPGRSTGPHLHYEILINGVAVDPIQAEPNLA